MNINPDDYVRLGTAAKIAGVTRAYLRRIIKAGAPEGAPAEVWLDGTLIVRREEAENLAKLRGFRPPKKKS